MSNLLSTYIDDVEHISTPDLIRSRGRRPEQRDLLDAEDISNAQLTNLLEANAAALQVMRAESVTARNLIRAFETGAVWEQPSTWLARAERVLGGK